MERQHPFTIGVCIWPEPGLNAARTTSYSTYVHEILAHAGPCYAQIAPEQLVGSLADLRVLVTVGETFLESDLRSALADWVRAGGSWISVGGVCGLDKLFGVAIEPPAFSNWGGGISTLGEGYLKRQAARHPVLAHVRIPLHFFNGLPVRAVRGRSLAGILDAHGRPTHRAGLVESRYGKGRTLLIAADLTGSVVRIQQGVAITRDGLSAADGSAPVCDGVLKSDDAQVLDWLLDRSPVPGVPGYSVFLEPVADQWRELLVRAILYACSKQRIPLPVLWLYPRNLSALAMMSHDTDGNDPKLARALLDALKKARINTTWCVIPPGYDRATIERIQRAGHELAVHFDAYSDGTSYTEVEFTSQYGELTALFGARPVTNKNHFLRWEGDTEFFEWLVRAGIGLDQSKGPSKTGGAGFNFGACHPYYPVRRDGSLLDVLELPTITMDIGHFAPREFAKPLMEAALRHHGILHLLFHPGHISKPRVARVLADSVQAAKRRGMEWWTACRIDEWERARRQACWVEFTQTEGAACARIRTGASLAQASFLLLGKAGRLKVNGKRAKGKTVRRWGFDFTSVQLDAQAGDEYRIEAGC